MSETLSHNVTDDTNDKLSNQPEREISDMEREARVLRHYGVTAVSAASSPLDNQLYRIADLREPVFSE